MPPSRRCPASIPSKSDVSDPAAIAALHASVLTQFPALDTLINNAGVMRNLDLNQTRDLNDVTREIEINLNGPVRMVQQFLPHLKIRKGALIVNVRPASLSSLFPRRRFIAPLRLQFTRSPNPCAYKWRARALPWSSWPRPPWRRRCSGAIRGRSEGSKGNGRDDPRQAGDLRH